MINKFFGIIILLLFIFQMKSAQKKYKSKFRVSFSVWGGGIGVDLPHSPENWLVPFMSPSLIWPKNEDFIISIQFLGILPKLSLPTSQPYLGNLKFDRKNYDLYQPRTIILTNVRHI